MTTLESLGSEAMEALASTKLAGIRKKLNAEAWTDNMENLMKQWGEKSAGLRFIHSNAGGSWKKFSNQLSIAGIVITSFASTVSLIATSLDDEETKTNVMYAVGGIGLISTLIQSFKKFYNAEEKAADHIAVSKQFGSFYRYMTLQLGMSREDRDPPDVLSSWALKEYERLQQEAPGIGGYSVETFKKKFNKDEQSFPDIAEDRFTIKVYRPKEIEIYPELVDNNKVETLNNVVEREESKELESIVVEQSETKEPPVPINPNESPEPLLEEIKDKNTLKF